MASGAPTRGDGDAQTDQRAPAPAEPARAARAGPPPPPGLQQLPVLVADDVTKFREVDSCHDEAHLWLAHLRQFCAHAGLPVVDLTHGLPDGVPGIDHAPTLVFDWRRYLCSLPQAWTLVRDGVTRFEGRFVNTPEPNALKLQLPEPYYSWRFDFVVHRSDGQCVRLHPLEGCLPSPIIGPLEPWLLPKATCAPTHRELSPVEVISSEVAQRVLANRLFAAAQQANLTPQQVSEDLFENDWFDWVRFLMSRAFGRALLKEGVFSVTLVGSDSTPAEPMLIVKTQANDWVISLQQGRATLRR